MSTRTDSKTYSFEEINFLEKIPLRLLNCCKQLLWKWGEDFKFSLQRLFFFCRQKSPPLHLSGGRDKKESGHWTLTGQTPSIFIFYWPHFPDQREQGKQGENQGWGIFLSQGRQERACKQFRTWQQVHAGRLQDCKHEELETFCYLSYSRQQNNRKSHVIFYKISKGPEPDSKGKAKEFSKGTKTRTYKYKRT